MIERRTRRLDCTVLSRSIQEIGVVDSWKRLSCHLCTEMVSVGTYPVFPSLRHPVESVNNSNNKNKGIWIFDAGIGENRTENPVQ